MDSYPGRKRPWLAAVLAIPVTGLGHVYLRRWQRALGWLLVVTAAIGLLVPPGVLGSPLTLVGTPLSEVAPIALIVGLSAADAYLLAQRENLLCEIRCAKRCPTCYRELSAGVGFCEWCGGALGTSR